jgi:hypothetical protein
MEELMTALAERRNGARFDIGREVQYWVLDAEGEKGLGATLDMSSRGLCFTTEISLRPGSRLQVAVDWPVALNDGVRLRLVARGRVIWSDSGRTGMVIEKYEFRTRSKSN